MHNGNYTVKFSLICKDVAIIYLTTMSLILFLGHNYFSTNADISVNEGKKIHGISIFYNNYYCHVADDENSKNMSR